MHVDSDNIFLVSGHVSISNNPYQIKYKIIIAEDENSAKYCFWHYFANKYSSVDIMHITADECLIA